MIFEENEDENSDNTDPLRYERITSIRRNERPKLNGFRNNRNGHVSSAF